MNNNIEYFIEFINNKNGIANKDTLIKQVLESFTLSKDRSIYYCNSFSVRFCHSKDLSFSGTVAGLSRLYHYDHIPFIVCLVTPYKNILFLSNTTLLKKISHSSHKLQIDNISGSFNGTDIFREINGIKNSPENFDKLFNIHSNIGFSGNIERLVEATHNIKPQNNKIDISQENKNVILSSVDRAIMYVHSNQYISLKDELYEKVNKYKDYILKSSLLENINLRGRIIEYIISEPDENLIKESFMHLMDGYIPDTKVGHTLGDYERIFNEYYVLTDIKTKIIGLNSNPKLYNVDKYLEFLLKNKSVFMIYFVGVEPDNKVITTSLISTFQTDLIQSTNIQRHWSGKNSRGETQITGNTIHNLIFNSNNKIDREQSINFLQDLILL